MLQTVRYSLECISSVAVTACIGTLLNQGPVYRSLELGQNLPKLVINLNCMPKMHGRRSQGTGGTCPQNLEWVTLMQIIPQNFKNTAQNSPKHAMSNENSFFFWGGGHTSPQPNLLDPPLRPQNSSKIYAYAKKSSDQGVKLSGSRDPIRFA